MPVYKETPSRLVKVGSTYAVIPSATIDLVGDAVALGILVYLMDKPIDWVPRKKDICNSLNIGDDRWKKATKLLSELDLFMVTDIRDEKGRFLDRIVTISAVPMGLSPKCGKPDLGKTQIGKTPPIHITENTHNILGWEEWISYRKEIKKKMSPATIKKQVAFLDPKTPEQQQSIIDQSITNGWTGLFEVKTNGQNKGNGKSSGSYQRRATAAESAQRLRDSIACDEAAMAKNERDVWNLVD